MITITEKEADIIVQSMCARAFVNKETHAAIKALKTRLSEAPSDVECISCGYVGPAVTGMCPECSAVVR